MADRRKDCIEEILDAIGRKLKRSDIEEHVEKIDERAEAYVADGMARAEALRRATEETLKEEAIKNAILKRNAREDAIKDRTRRQFYEEAVKQRPRMALRDRGAADRQFPADVRSEVAHRQPALGRGAGARRQEGLDRRRGRISSGSAATIRSSPGSTRCSIRARSRTISSARSGSTTRATAASPASPRTSRRARSPRCCTNGTRSGSSLNAEGAWITDYAGYMTKLSHDPDRIRRAARPFKPRDPGSYMYKGFSRPTANTGRTRRCASRRAPHLRRPRRARQGAGEMFGGFVTGDHLELETSPASRCSPTSPACQPAARVPLEERRRLAGLQQGVRPLLADRGLAALDQQERRPLRADEGVRLEAQGGLRERYRLRQELTMGTAARERWTRPPTRTARAAGCATASRGVRRGRPAAGQFHGRPGRRRHGGAADPSSASRRWR
jgi:hypothetical protein